jgi:hypothetical protein
VSTWLPDHIGFDKFAANYTQSVSLATTALTGLVYAPCIISNLPTGAAISATGIAISPLGVYITPEGANIQPEGFKASPRPALALAGPNMRQAHQCMQAEPL